MSVVCSVLAMARFWLRWTTRRVDVDVRAVAGRETTRRDVDCAVLGDVVVVAARADFGRATMRRGWDIGLVLTTISIGLLVMVTVVPGFNSVFI